MSYDKVREDLIKFEKDDLNKNLDEKKIMAFKATNDKEREEPLHIDEIVLITRNVVDSFR